MMRASDLRRIFEEALRQYLLAVQTPLELLKPMVYSLNSGGKRLRPLMLLTILEAIDPRLIDKGLATAIALEFIHTYSLIHDDLPAMDNDDLRRGQPTSHVKFNEATAILAGDALLTDAFGLIAQDRQLDPVIKARLIADLVYAAGSTGMVAGQLDDVNHQDQSVSIDHLKQTHLMKTGYLFIFAVKAGGRIGKINEKAIDLLSQFGHHFGTAYQIHNDLKDILAIESDPDSLLKSDEANHKSTYPSLLGVQESKDQLKHELHLAASCIQALNHQTGLNFSGLEQFLGAISIE